MKKLLAIALATVLIFALAVPAMGTDASTGPDTATLEGVGFHCDHGTGVGNGKTSVYYSEEGVKASSEILDAKGKVLKGVAADTGTKFKFDFERIDETTWKLVSEFYYCVTCGNNIWASYSNKSGVPNGKNIQVNPYTPPEESPVEDYGSLVILKTVGGVPFAEWAIEQGLSPEEIYEIISGMSFTAYLLDSEDGERTGRSFPGDMGMNGAIDFGTELPFGWYEVAEEISGLAVNYFVGEGQTKVYYVGEDGVSSEVQNFVSGREGIGEIVAHTGEGVNWPLPWVWNDRLGADPTFQKLMGMDAHWIWDCYDTYKYGVEGSEIELEFEVTLGEAIDVPIYFAADNVALIYVNGKLAACTTVALDGKGIEIGDDYIGTDVLGDKQHGNFDGRWNEGWAHVYEANISLDAGVNEIIIIAANSASAGHLDDLGNFVKGTTGTDNDSYDLKNNPCGLIFGFEIPAVTFDNEPVVDPFGSLTVAVDFEVEQDTVTYKPVYEPVTDSRDEATLTLDGTFGDNNINYVKLSAEEFWANGYEGEVAVSFNNSGNDPRTGIYFMVSPDGSVTFDRDVFESNYSVLLYDGPDFHNRDNKHGNKFYDFTDGGEYVYLYFHNADGLKWYTGELEFVGWEVDSREPNPVDPIVEELVVELWFEEEMLSSQNLTGELTYTAIFDKLKDGEYSIIVRGSVNGEEFSVERAVVIEDNNDASENFKIEVKLVDKEVYPNI